MMTKENVYPSIEGLPENSTVVEKLNHTLAIPIRDFVLDVWYRVVVFMACLTLIVASAMVWSPAPEVRLPSPDFWGSSYGFQCVFLALVMIFAGLSPRTRKRPVLQLLRVLAVIAVDASLIAGGFTILCVGLGYVGPQKVFRAHAFLSNNACIGVALLTVVNVYFGNRTHP